METNNQHRRRQPAATGMRNSGGEIVEVQGGHIVRATGRKDRHSKVCTAKGPRDRRVRLSAPTAIQFYDVQDRLGYDRPSKAVDWLIKKAKSAIDELAELPAWTPTTTTTRKPPAIESDTHEQDFEFPMEEISAASARGCGELQGIPVRHKSDSNSSFLPPSMDSDSIAYTIKSFFPLDASAETNSSALQLQNFPPDLLSRTSSHNQSHNHSQDLKLSLHSFQDPMLSQSQSHENHHHHNHQNHHQMGFDGSSSEWAENYQRMVAWNPGGGSGGGNGDVSGVGFLYNSLSPQQPLPLLVGENQNQFFSQRESLQSINMPYIRTWMDPVMTDNHHQYQSNFTGFSPFSGFQIPARIQGEDEEHHDGLPNKPSSASSNTRH